MRPHRLTYANVMSTVAVSVALGGSSYAAVELAENSVGSAQIRNGSVRAVDLAKGAKGRGHKGAKGAKGAPGPVGPKGADGAPGPSQVLEAKHQADTAIAGAADTQVTLATVHLTPGSWLLEAQTQISLDANAADNYFCDLATADNGFLNRGTATIGRLTGSALYSVISARSTFVATAATDIVFRCAHHNDVPAAATASDTVLDATKAGAVDEQ